MVLQTEWLGRMGYRTAWRHQHELVEARAAGRIADQLLLVEHEPVLTLGIRSEARHVRASPALLAKRGIEVIQVERGGEVTYHGPGQLVAYPIIRLADRGVLLRPFVRALEAAMSDVAAIYGVTAGRRDGYPGCWCDPTLARPRKLGALGLKVQQGVTLHGIALNVSTDLTDFGLIDACGLVGLEATSLARELDWHGVDARGSTDLVHRAGLRFAEALQRRLREVADRAAVAA
ncbi:MAG: lipoyl(octanoyl) transferase LipB [Chloroflexi bacterium]|nr:lipoyl(octanoyl) transferase LipB [Chloroflexota bacterium]